MFKKLLLFLLITTNVSFTCLPVYANDIQVDSSTTKVYKDYSTDNCVGDAFKMFLFLLGIGLLLLVLTSPIIIWISVYENLPEDSGLKFVMNIAQVIFTILTLGLICLHKKR